MSTDDVIIVNYDPDWPRRYEQERPRILEALGDIVVDIQHVGSTSVPQLAAKPIIDIQVTTRRLPLRDNHLSALEAIGYEFRRYNEPWWAFLRKGMPRTHHLHIVDISDEAGCAENTKTLLFRDYIRANYDAAREYETLKRDLASRFASERMAYSQNKTEFILAALEKAQDWQASQAKT